MRASDSPLRDLSGHITVLGSMAKDRPNPAVAILTAAAMKNLGIPEGKGAARRLAEKLGLHGRDDERKIQRLINGSTNARFSTLLPVLLHGRLLKVNQQTLAHLLAIQEELEAAARGLQPPLGGEGPAPVRHAQDGRGKRA